MKIRIGRLIKSLGPLMAGFLLLLIAAPIAAQDHSQHARPTTTTNTAKPSTSQQNQPMLESLQDVPQVEISPEQQKLIGVKTVKAALMPMKKNIRTIGRVETDESRQATVNAKIEGWIEKLYVDKTGSYVKKARSWPKFTVRNLSQPSRNF